MESGYMRRKLRAIRSDHGLFDSFAIRCAAEEHPDTRLRMTRTTRERTIRGEVISLFQNNFIKYVIYYYFITSIFNVYAAGCRYGYCFGDCPERQVESLPAVETNIRPSKETAT
jgi:hypothetical protein